MDLTNTIQKACTYTESSFDQDAWLRFIDMLVTSNGLEYSWDDEDDTWLNVMNSEGKQVFFTGRELPLIFVDEQYTLVGLDAYGNPLEIVKVKDWWSQAYTINLNELTGACLVWDADEIPSDGPFSLLDFVYATH